MHLLFSLLAAQAEQSMCLGSCTFKSGLEIGVKRVLHKLKLTHLHEVAAWLVLSQEKSLWQLG